MTEVELKELRRRIEKLEERVRWLETKMKLWEKTIRDVMSRRPRKP